MADTPTQPTPPSDKARTSSAAISIVVDMADTTWRLFIPTVGLLMAGRALDAHFGTKPWLMLAGTAVGALLAALLVQRQLKRQGDS